jgi:hypothetical protein
MQPRQRILRSRQRAATLVLFLTSLAIVGCTTLGARTMGVSGPLTWHVTDLSVHTVALELREQYSFTLVLQETPGRALTFATLTAHFQNSRGSRPVFWEQTGAWSLPAHGTLRIPLTSSRYCPYVHCRESGALAPEWYITLTGTKSGGQPMHYALTLRLPTAPS